MVHLLAMKRGVQGYRLILVGVGVAAMLTAANGYLITRANLADAQAAAVWLTGSLNGRDWSQVIRSPSRMAILLPIAMYLGRGLRMLELGDDTARALGVPAGSGRGSRAPGRRRAGRDRHRQRGPDHLRGAGRSAGGAAAHRRAGPNIVPSALTRRAAALRQRPGRAAVLRPGPTAGRRRSTGVLGGIDLLGC